MESAGKDLSTFIQKDVDEINKIEYKSKSMEDMGFKDIVNLSDAIDAIREGIYTVGAPELVLPNVGMAKAKLDLFLEYKEMPSYLKDVISEQMNKAISIKKQSVRLGDTRTMLQHNWMIENSFRERNGLETLSFQSLRERFQKDDGKDM